MWKETEERMKVVQRKWRREGRKTKEGGKYERRRVACEEEKEKRRRKESKKSSGRKEVQHASATCWLSCKLSRSDAMYAKDPYKCPQSEVQRITVAPMQYRQVPVPTVGTRDSSISPYLSLAHSVPNNCSAGCACTSQFLVSLSPQQNRSYSSLHLKAVTLNPILIMCKVKKSKQSCPRNRPSRRTGL
jgi:hypothetical protein